MSRFFLTLFGLLTVSFSANAQDEGFSSLEQAIEFALENNGYQQVAETEILKAIASKKGAWQLPKTEMGLLFVNQGGSQNWQPDYFLKQELKFPSYYRSSHQLAKSQIEIAERKAVLQAHELKHEIRKAWQELAYLRSKQNKLMEADSIQKLLLNKSDSANAIDRLSFVLLVNEQYNELQNIEAQIDVSIRNINALLNNVENLEVKTGPLQKRDLDMSNMKSAFVVNPKVALRQKELAAASLERKKAIASALPDFSIAYYQNSRTTAAITDSWTNIVQVGMSVPIFYGREKAQIEKAKYTKQQLETLNTFHQNKNSTEIEKAATIMGQTLTAFNRYRDFLLPRADSLITETLSAFKTKKVTKEKALYYLNQAKEIKLNHLSALYEYNLAIIELEYALGL